MKTLLYIMSLCAAYIFLSVQFDVLAQSSSPAATRAYCDNNRNVAVQMAVQNMSTNLQPMVSQEVERVSQSFVTNAYPVPVPVPVTNTVYVETVVSNQIIYQTTQVEVYATYSITTNTYMNFITNIVTEYTTNIEYQIATNYVIDVTNINTHIDRYIATNVTEVQQFIVDVSVQTNSYFEVGIDNKLRLYMNGTLLWEEK